MGSLCFTNDLSKQCVMKFIRVIGNFVFICCVFAISKHFAFTYMQSVVHMCSWSCDSIYRCRWNNNEIYQNKTIVLDNLQFMSSFKIFCECTLLEYDLCRCNNSPVYIVSVHFFTSRYSNLQYIWNFLKVKFFSKLSRI